MLTSDIYWDPICIDYEGQLDNEEWFDAPSSFTNGPDSKLFNEHREHQNTSEYYELQYFDSETFEEDILDCL